jgi:hypothetical protein
MTHEHTWNLWTPMDDGTDRWSRKCKECGMYQVNHGQP